MDWRTGVREITYEIFSQIVEAARVTRGGKQLKRANVADANPIQTEPSELLIKRPLTKSRSGYGLKPSSRELRQIGEWAEELVYRWLSIKLETGERDTLDWVAQRGETPGWDIAYTAESGAMIHVEVKATTLGRFSGIDITGNEWSAAQRDGENYVLALVTRAMSAQPSVAFLKNPAKHAEDGSVAIEPTSFRLTARGDA